MKKLMLAIGITALICGGCVHQCRDTTLYQLSGRQKPIVAVLPVIDHTSNLELRWDLSKEMTDEIRKRVYESKRIYLLRDAGTAEIARELSTPNIRAISQVAASSLGAAQFAVVAELIEQDETSYGVSRTSLDRVIDSDVGAVLSLALRIRVIDVRSEVPKVILQEVIDQDYVIARAYMHCDYDRYPWGTEAFSRTPMGMAHNKLVHELVARIEAYIEASL